MSLCIKRKEVPEHLKCYETLAHSLAREQIKYYYFRFVFSVLLIYSRCPRAVRPSRQHKMNRLTGDCLYAKHTLSYLPITEGIN